MLDEIKIIDEKTYISLFILNDKIYVLSNNYPLNINEYLKKIKTNNVIKFYQSGESSIRYKGHESKEDKKVFHFGKITIVISLATLLLINSMTLSSSKIYYLNYSPYEISNYKVEDLRDMIYSSKGLNDEEKELLYNEDFFEDLTSVINDYDYIKYMYSIYFDNIGIESYEEAPINIPDACGYYSPNKPNVLNIQNYGELSEYKKDTIVHEFIHLCQESNGYNLIIEACAEILSKEYYNMKESCYSTQVRYVKALMEIIGSEPIWVYNFTGDFSLIEQSVKPYLSNEEYNEFLDDLTFDYNDYNINKPKFESLEIILSKLYSKVRGGNIEDDKVISLINKYNGTMQRYYFNKRLINKENSYYLNYEEGEYKTVSLDEAMKLDLIQIYSYKETPLDPKTAIELANEGKNSITRTIDYKSAKIIINRATFQNSKMIFSGTVNGLKYEDCDIDDLVLEGIIKIDYCLVDMHLLSAKEYLNHEYEDDVEIKVYKKSDTEFNEEDRTVYGFVPKKDYLPLTSEINNNNNKQLKLE